MLARSFVLAIVIARPLAVGQLSGLMRYGLIVVRVGCSLLFPRSAGVRPWLILEVIDILKAAFFSKSKICIINSSIVKLVESGLRSPAFLSRFRFA